MSAEVTMQGFGGNGELWRLLMVIRDDTLWKASHFLFPVIESSVFCCQQTGSLTSPHQ